MVERPQTGPWVWRSADLAADRSWVVVLDDTQRAEIVTATRAAVAAGVSISAVTRDDMVLPTLGPTIRAWSTELATGRGVVLVRRFPVDLLSPREVELSYAGVGAHLGRPVGQNSAGELITHVRDERLPESAGRVRLYRTRERQDFHTDGADVIGLLCLHPARSGGESKVVSSAAIYNHMLAERPDLVAALRTPMGWDRQGDVPDGAAPWFLLAPLFDVDGEPRLFYLGWYIRDSQQHADAPRLTAAQLEAMEMLERLANDPTFHLEMTLEPGDLQLLNNGRVLHAREAYDDHDDPAERRHLLRLWLAAHDFASVEEGLRGGIAVHRPEVLFVCVHNAGRSQMAAALLAHHAGDRVVVRSAGTAPADDINPAVVAVMAERGIDLRASGAHPKRLDEAMVSASDVVITMGCGDTCPFFPGTRYLDWPLADPAGQGVDAVRPIRDEIERLVLSLLEEIL